MTTNKYDLQLPYFTLKNMPRMEMFLYDPKFLLGGNLT